MFVLTQENRYAMMQVTEDQEMRTITTEVPRYVNQADMM